MSKLDQPVTIHFKEDNIPGLRRGELTTESKQQIKDLFDGIIFESEEPGGPKSLRSYDEITEMLEAP